MSVLGGSEQNWRPERICSFASTNQLRIAKRCFGSTSSHTSTVLLVGTSSLPTFLREYDKVARQCAAEDVDYPRYLLRMSELELLDRERRATERRVRQAKFPVVKSLDSFDFLAIPSLNKAMVLELVRSEFLLRRENVLLLGNSGTGKTMSPWPSAWLPASAVIACASPPQPRWSTN